MAQNEFDLSCLRGIATDPDAQRIALAVAMIKMTALSMARRSPDLRDDALQIVDQARRLFGTLPTRASIEALVDAHSAPSSVRSASSAPSASLGRPGSAGSDPAGPDSARSDLAPDRRGREALIDALWQHFQDGRTPTGSR